MNIVQINRLVLFQTRHGRTQSSSHTLRENEWKVFFPPEDNFSNCTLRDLLGLLWISVLWKISQKGNCYHFDRHSSLIIFPDLFLRQTHKLLIWQFILFRTTCFSHQALVTCCLQLIKFEPTPQQVKVVLNQIQNQTKKWKYDHNLTTELLRNLVFKNQAPQGLADPLPSSTSSPDSPDPLSSTVHSPSVLSW